MGIVSELIKDAYVPLMSLAWFLAGLVIGMRVRGRRAGSGAGAAAGGGRVRTTEIYVGNLPEDASEGDIRKAFERFGQVKDVRLINSHADGSEKTFAFLSMGAVEQAQAAVDGMNGRSLGGRTVIVSEARSRRRRGRR